MRVYISGPITNDPNYMEHFENAERQLLDQGYESIVNPATVNKWLPNDFTHAEYMEVCLAQLNCCNVIYMLNGWEQSKGAMIELGYAKEHGHGIIYESEVG